MSYVREIFEERVSEVCKFENVSTRLSNRADLNAFMLLDKLVPGCSRIVLCSDYDGVLLNVTEEMLVEAKVSEEDVLNLILCGITLDSDGYLYMYV